MMKDNELKPCPFCEDGGMIKLECLNNIFYYSISCINPRCFIKPSTIWFETEQEAIDAWNIREHKQRWINENQ